MKTIISVFGFISIAYSVLAFGDCETKQAGEMLGLVESFNIHYLLDSEGQDQFTLCKGAINLSRSSEQITGDLNKCIASAYKAAFYDMSPHSNNFNRPVFRNCK